MEQENRTSEDVATAGTQDAVQAKPRWGRRLVIGGLAAAAVAGVGLAAATGGEFGPGRGHGWGGPGWGGHAMHASMGHGFAERGLDRVLDGLDATPEQAKKIRDIVEAAHDDLEPAIDGMRDTREKVAALLGAPTIDRTAAEALRAERVAAVDQASRRLTAAILDAAEVLTPEQRAKLVEHFKDRGRHGRW